MKKTLGWSLALGILMRVSIGSADGTCKVLVVPAESSEAWRTASRAFEDRAKNLPTSERDCREAIVDVRQSGALVSITTGDGRRAARPVADPAGLDAVLSALVMTVSAADVPPDFRAAPEPMLLRTSVPEQDAPAPPIAGTGPSPISWRLGAAGGGRMALAGTYVSPSVTIATSLTFRYLEVGVFGAREIAYVPAAGSAPAGFDLSATSVGIWGGLHRTVGQFALIGGAWLAGARVREQITTPGYWAQGMGMQTGNNPDQWVSAANISSSSYEARVGGYGAVAFPARSKLRLRSQLGFDGAVLRIGDGIPTDFPLAPVPRLGTTLSLGIEGSVL